MCSNIENLYAEENENKNAFFSKEMPNMPSCLAGYGIEKGMKHDKQIEHITCLQY